MDEYLVWLIILLVVGVVVSNIMVLKYTAKFKWPGAKSSKTEDDSDQDTDTKD
ncbi:DUF2897 family protein [Idiomarina sp. HP20-50]|uniref:DUF2897 family protein n=1 Tax=Idiomarina sp. HP20-50 TaxID=3070813 RepID=UPI00294ADA78|nr:DUF2897 family protein [Idiomarina sp. HP20-50]MDV6314953.1 DUF2897 family protein [Idiomarina sp. HP20-50]